MQTTNVEKTNFTMHMPLDHASKKPRFNTDKNGIASDLNIH